jgi:hypothetical protein
MNPKLRTTELRTDKKVQYFYSNLHVDCKSKSKVIFNCPTISIIKLPLLTELKTFDEKEVNMMIICDLQNPEVTVLIFPWSSYP